MASARKATDTYSNKTTAQAFWSMYPALVIANIIPTLAGLVNGLIVGNAYSPAEMAAVSFAAPVIFFITAVAVVFSSGAGIVYGRYLGRGKAEDVHKVYTTDLIISIITGVIITIAGEIFAVPIARLIGAKDDTLMVTAVYLRGLFIGAIPALIMPSLVTFLNLGNEARYGMMSSLVLAVCNLIFGLLNVNVIKGDMFGIGLGSSLSQFCAMIFLFVKFIKHPELGHTVKVSEILPESLKIIRYGIPAAALQAGAAFRNIFINSMTLLAGGTIAVAGLGILNSSSGIFCSVHVALISASATLISICVGEEDRASLYNLVRFLLKWGAIIFAGVTVIFFTTAPYIAVLFGAEGEGIKMAAMCIRIYCAEMITAWFGFVVLGSYQSLGRSVLATGLQLVNTCVYGIGAVLLAAYVLPENIRLYGVWSCYGVAQIFGIITIFIIASIKSGHFPKGVEDLLWLDKDFGIADEDKIAISVNTIEDVVSVSETVQNFLTERGIDNSRSYKTALCLEEMAGNIVSHGFTKTEKKKNLSIDIYVAVKDDEIKIRLKDNAPQFDPFKKLEQYKEDDNDPMKNIGIRMVTKMAKEMKYQTTLGMNVLLIQC